MESGYEMPALISVIIPTLDEERTIGSCLEHLFSLDGRWEVIVADSGSTDRTIEIARAASAAVVEDAPAGRGDAMNAGATWATGDILLFLHADTLLPEDAYRQIVDGLSDPDVAATGFRLRMDWSDRRYRLLALLGVLRFRLQRTFFGDQAIAVRRADFWRVGGYQEPILMEDVDLSRRLRKLGALRLLPSHVVTSARRFEQGGLFRTLAMMSGLQVAYMLGVSGTRLSRWYKHIRELSEPAAPPPESVDLPALSFYDEGESEIRLSDLAGRPVLLIFLRWLG